MASRAPRRDPGGRRGRVVRARRRVGLRQVHGRVRRAALPAAQRPRERRIDLGGRRGPARDERPRRAHAAGEQGLDGLPEPDRRAEPVAPDRAPGGGGVHAPGCRRQRGGGPRARDAHEGPDLGSGRRHAALPASAVGRHEPARDHRDGAGQGPDAAHSRRADDRPRRHGRGRGPRPRVGPARGVPLERPLHQPQPRRHRAHVRPRRRPVRGPRGGGGPGRRGLQQPAPSLHGRPAALHPARRRHEGQGQARHHPRLPARARGRAARLRVRRPLRPLAGRLRPEGAGADPARRRPLQPLPLPRAGAAAAARGEPGAGQGRARQRWRHADPAHGERAQDVPPGRARGARGRGPHLRARGGRDARARRRVGQRQDDPGPAAPRAHRAGRGLGRRARRHAARGQHPQARPRAGQGRPDRLPEPGLRAQPAVLDPAHHRPRGDDADGREGRQGGVAAARPRPLRPVRRAPDPAAAVAALGRVEAARRDRARVRRRSEDRRLRRADVGARRLRAGRDPQPPRGAAGGEGRRLPVHLARPRRRALPVRPDRRPLPRAPDGAGRGRHRVRPAAASVHGGPALRRAERGRHRAGPDPARGRHPEPRRPAVRLRVPHALPALHRRRLRERGAGPQGGRAGALLALPLLGRRAARAAAHRAGRRGVRGAARASEPPAAEAPEGAS